MNKDKISTDLIKEFKSITPKRIYFAKTEKEASDLVRRYEALDYILGGLNEK